MLGALSHSHYMALAFGGTFLINEPSLQTTSLFVEPFNARSV